MKTKTRITKGKALILARDAYGPGTHVQLRGKDHVILDRVGGKVIADARDWRGALEALRHVKKAA